MNSIAKSLILAGMAGLSLLGQAQANNVAVSGNIYTVTGGTSYDLWHFSLNTTTTFSVDLLAYEASQKSVSTAGYYTSDLNADGQITFLDPDTSWFTDTGNAIAATDFLARCDDVLNNCPTVSTSTISLTDYGVLSGNSIGAVDGSISSRDPSYTVTLAAGNYWYAVGDYRITPAEVAAGLNAGDTLTAPSGLSNPPTQAAYRITLNSVAANFAVDGKNITVSAVPLPGSIWFIGSGVLGLLGLARNKTRS
jgi:hypothetical protein